MKKILILIVAIAVFLHFYPQPEVDSKYEEYKTMFINMFSNATDTKIRLRADKIYEDLSADFSGFSSEEIDKLKEVTANRDEVKNFYSEYCFTEKGHPIFHNTNLEKVCTTVNKYQSLL